MFLLWGLIGLYLVGLFSPLFIPKKSTFRYYAAFVSYLFAALCYVFSFGFTSFKNPRNGKNYRKSEKFAKLLFNILGVNVTVNNPERLEQHKNYILILNHQSALDIISMTQIWKWLGNCAIVHKKEIFSQFPFLRWIMWCLASIPLDRTQTTQSSIHQLTSLADQHFKMPDDRKSILIFPEGKRTNNEKCIQPFKKGAFHLAIDLKVAIVPVVISPYYFLKDFTYFHGGEIIMQVLEPIKTDDLEKNDVDNLSKSVHQKMNKVFNELAIEVHKRDQFKME